MIQFLRGTSSQLQSSNQIFAAGQPVFESDSGQLKVGDGLKTFANLPYVGAGLSGGGSNQYVRVSEPGSKSRVNGYIDLNDNLRLVFGEVPATFSSITSTGVYVDGDYTNNGRNFGIPGNTGTIEETDLRSMYGIKSQYFILRFDSANSGTNHQSVYQCATWLDSQGELDWGLGFKYIGASTGAVQNVYLVLLTWD